MIKELIKIAEVSFGPTDDWLLCGPYRPATEGEKSNPDCFKLATKLGEIVPVRKNGNGHSKENGLILKPLEQVLTEGQVVELEAITC